MGRILKSLAAKVSWQVFDRWILPLVFSAATVLFGSIYWPLWGPWWAVSIAVSSATLATLLIGLWKYENGPGKYKRESEAKRLEVESKRRDEREALRRALRSLDSQEQKVVDKLRARNTMGIDITSPVIAGLLDKGIVRRLAGVVDIDKWPITLSEEARECLGELNVECLRKS